MCILMKTKDMYQSAESAILLAVNTWLLLEILVTGEPRKTHANNEYLNCAENKHKNESFFHL